MFSTSLEQQGQFPLTTSKVNTGHRGQIAYHYSAHVSRGRASRQSGVHCVHQTGARPLLHQLHRDGRRGVAAGGPEPRPRLPGSWGRPGGQLPGRLGHHPWGRGHRGGRHQLWQVLRGQTQPWRQQPQPRHHLHTGHTLQVSQLVFCFQSCLWTILAD